MADLRDELDRARRALVRWHVWYERLGEAAPPRGRSPDEESCWCTAVAAYGEVEADRLFPQGRTEKSVGALREIGAIGGPNNG